MNPTNLAAGAAISNSPDEIDGVQRRPIGTENAWTHRIFYGTVSIVYVLFAIPFV